MGQDGLTSSLRKKLAGLELQRDSFARLLEGTERADLHERYFASIQRLSAEIDSLKEALDYNTLLDNTITTGPWIAVPITHVQDHDPMDGVHIEIVDEDPEAPPDHIEVALVTADPESS